ncbi:putative succinyl-diaminopimelate desuccinylase [Rubripirellula lacrimiformis]|uniref:Probable succinyl-diaminopimelate desuccinylase n=1 Tax=Rubripirellula lacrimiformis TaxID=1930273 RepID=A0A517NCE3_9BACT|nr:M20 family metallopeptidase [Rubripirellula lacrimiformis]QDT04807.1 putative succinyl-diaminopimelate desuccinylase [Rubripirellula lacrimiformis]
MTVKSPSPDDPVSLLADLVRINSVNPNYDGGVPEAEMADYVDRYFTQRGIETWRQQVYPDRPNVIARVPGLDSSRRIVLEAHMDTVSVVGMTIPPWTPEIRQGRMYGRGSCDTKGGMAAMMNAVSTMVSAGTTPPCDVLFTATIDEEFSYRGVVALCDSLEPGPVDAAILTTESSPTHPWTADAAIIAEPTDLRAVIASKGLVRWKIVTTGRSSHSAKPHLGVNAIEHMAHVITAIESDTRRLAKSTHPLLGPATCNIGVVRGGVQINFVPDRCEIEIDRRLLPGETRETVLQHYQDLVDKVAVNQTSMQVTMEPPMLSDRPLETNASSKAVRNIVSVLEDMNLDATPAGVPFCSDASKFGALGIPSMILGPGSIDQAHAAVEYIECSQVVQAAEIYRRFLLA